MQQGNLNHIQDHKSRRAYAAPKLTIYGALVDLTATGSGGSNESGGSFMNCAAGFKLAMACQTP